MLLPPNPTNWLISAFLLYKFLNELGKFFSYVVPHVASNVHYNLLVLG